MKKNKFYREKKQVLRNTKRSNKAKKRNFPRVVVNSKLIKAHCPVETTRDFEIGPSLVTEIKDGKTTNYNSWSSNNKQKPTSIAKAVMESNRATKISKKEAIKKILTEAGYYSTDKHTRKDRHRFSRIVKKKLFAQPKKNEVAKENNKQTKEKNQMSMSIPEQFYSQLPSVKGKQAPKSAEVVNTKEVPKKRKFKFVVQRRRSEDPMKCYDFKTDYFYANTVKEAKQKVEKEAKKYKKDTSFSGITIQDIEGDNSIIFYTGKSLLAAA